MVAAQKPKLWSKAICKRGEGVLDYKNKDYEYRNLNRQRISKLSAQSARSVVHPDSQNKPINFIGGNALPAPPPENRTFPKEKKRFLKVNPSPAYSDCKSGFTGLSAYGINGGRFAGASRQRRSSL